MARPIKNSCDYFPHDAGMRNHRKIKSIRQKFGITGYAIWCMIIEYLTESDGNVFEDTELEFELMSGDFGVSVTETREVVDYCYRLELLFLNNGFVSSESLDERLKPVYDKRGRAKEMSAKQIRKNGLFHRNTDKGVVSVTETPIDTVVSDTETPQSKLNKIKLNNNIINNENIEIPISEKTIRNQYDNFLLKTSTQKEQMAMGNAMTNRQIDIACIGFVSSLLESGELKMSSIYPNFHKHFRNWFNKFGKENLGTIPKDRIELEFRTFKINEFSEKNKIDV